MKGTKHLKTILDVVCHLHDATPPHLVVDEEAVERGGLGDGLEEGGVLLRQRLLASQPPRRVLLPPLLQPLLQLLLLPRHVPVVERHLRANTQDMLLPYIHLWTHLR